MITPLLQVNGRYSPPYSIEKTLIVEGDMWDNYQ